MALIIGGNSYVTQAEADAYFADRLHSDDWTNADPADQEKALLMARRTLDDQAFVGAITSETQSLAWPRAGVVDREGRSIDQTEVPEVIKHAQCELAITYLRNDPTLDAAHKGVRRIREKVDVLETDVTYATTGPKRGLPDAVKERLKPFLAEVGGAASVKMVV